MNCQRRYGTTFAITKKANCTKYKNTDTVDYSHMSPALQKIRSLIVHLIHKISQSFTSASQCISVWTGRRMTYVLQACATFSALTRSALCPARPTFGIYRSMFLPPPLLATHVDCPHVGTQMFIENTHTHTHHTQSRSFSMIYIYLHLRKYTCQPKQLFTIVVNERRGMWYVLYYDHVHPPPTASLYTPNTLYCFAWPTQIFYTQN
jgi:hypothetical protein